MKKKTKKLSLNRETLVHLDRNLSQVGGGATQFTVCGSCNCTFSGRATCNTCEATCTTNFC